MQNPQAKAYVNLSALIHNAKILKKACLPARFCAVVKADAYGHGACEVADAIQEFADCFAVCSVEEGVCLRRAGIVKPIICLLPQYDLLRAHFYGLTLSVSHEKEALLISNFCKERGVKMKVHLALNTGMNRFGLDDVAQIGRILPLFKGGRMRLEGVYSHFFNVSKREANDEQLERFNNLRLALKEVEGDAIAHISSGEGLAFGDRYKLDMVRVGLMLYGYDLAGCNLNLARVMSLRADCYCERHIVRGSGLLYGDFVADEDKEVKIMPFGYFNGIYFGLDGQINNCAMNVCAVSKGTSVLMNDALAVAKRSGKICYDVLTSIGMNNPRIYYYGDAYENNCGKI